MPMTHDHDYSNTIGQPQPIPRYRPRRIEKSELSNVEQIAILTIVICMLFWTAMLLATAWALGGTGTLMITLALSVGYWVVLWVTYYVMWRWFWVMTALGWIISSLYGCGTLVLIGDVTGLLIRLIPRI